MPNEITSELHKEHQEVDQILKKLEKSESSGRKELLDELQEKLIPHMKGEEQKVYPKIKDKTPGDVQEALEEHEQAKKQLELLVKTKPDDESFEEKLMQLKDMIQHHVKEEEDKIFKTLKNSFEKDELKQMYEDYEQAEESFKKKLH